MYGLSAKKVNVVERFTQESMYGLSAKKVTIVEKFKQELMYGLSAKKSGRCREVYTRVDNMKCMDCLPKK